MRLPRLRPNAAPHFALARAGEIATHEGWVERVRRRRGRVDVELLLDDGSSARVPLDAEQASGSRSNPGRSWTSGVVS